MRDVQLLWSALGDVQDHFAHLGGSGRYSGYVQGHGAAFVGILIVLASELTSDDLTKLGSSGLQGDRLAELLAATRGRHAAWDRCIDVVAPLDPSRYPGRLVDSVLRKVSEVALAGVDPLEVLVAEVERHLPSHQKDGWRDFVEATTAGGVQGDFFRGTAVDRSLLDELLSRSRLYTKSKDYKDLLDFVARLRNFAPFNAMLLHVQKPGLTYAASERDWRERFGRRPKRDARPLLIMWPFGPVALVYDVQDTEGRALPDDAMQFFTRGDVTSAAMVRFTDNIKKRGISTAWFDAGEAMAGRVRRMRSEESSYEVNLNQNHSPVAQFGTLVHELGHLFLGHLGADKKLSIPKRRHLPLNLRELEAESVAYVMCQRNGVELKSESYLSSFVTEATTVDDLDVYQVMRAAGQVEEILGLREHTQFRRPS